MPDTPSNTPLPPFLDTLDKGPVVFDGATGTLLYERGVYLDKCFDELCLSRPALVSQVHLDYVLLGVDVIETNTYGANRLALARHGLEDRVEDIARAGARLALEAAQGRAYVAGSMGPTGLLPKDLIRTATRTAAIEAFREQAHALVGAGVHLLALETFGYLGELELAVEAASGLGVPLVALASLDEAHRTRDGAEPEEVAERLCALGVEVIGANCVLGPERLLPGALRMLGDGRRVLVQPNAGYPCNVDGRAIYQSSPETFGVCARRAFKAGIAGFGGCCGTGPEHVRRLVAAARMLGGGRWRDTAPALATASDSQRRKAVPMEMRSRLAAKIARGEWAVSVEMLPPADLDTSRVLERIRRLEGSGVDVVNIPDGPRAMARMSNTTFARLVLEHTDMEPLVHLCARDRNLLAVQADLLGAHALGVRNLVVITGDPPKLGDYPNATAVFDLDSVGTLRMASGFNHGIDPAGKPIGGQTEFLLATGVEPAASDFDREMRRLAEKQAAGAELVMTQPVYDPLVLERFLAAAEPLGLPILVGILPIASLRNAEFLSANVPGMRIPDAILERIRSAPPERVHEEGIRIAAETLSAVRHRVQGAYIMPPFGRVEAALEVIRLVG